MATGQGYAYGKKEENSISGMITVDDVLDIHYEQMVN
jgi:hypothetical protein